MLNDILYSIREHLKTDPDVEANEVLTYYDGLVLDNREKPFIVVESLFDDFEVLAAGRTDYEETYALQIGIRAESEHQLNKLKRTVTRSLRKKVTLYNTSTEPFAASGFFYVDVDRVEVVRPDDISRETDFHRAYITAEVTVNFDNTSGGFTQ